MMKAVVILRKEAIDKILNRNPERVKGGIDGKSCEVTLGNSNDGLGRAIADARSARRRRRRNRGMVEEFNEVPVERGGHYVACNAHRHHPQTKPNHNATAIHTHLSQTVCYGVLLCTETNSSCFFKLLFVSFFKGYFYSPVCLIN